MPLASSAQSAAAAVRGDGVPRVRASANTAITDDASPASRHISASSSKTAAGVGAARAQPSPSNDGTAVARAPLRHRASSDPHQTASKPSTAARAR